MVERRNFRRRRASVSVTFPMRGTIGLPMVWSEEEN